ELPALRSGVQVLLHRRSDLVIAAAIVVSACAGPPRAVGVRYGPGPATHPSRVNQTWCSPSSRSSRKRMPTFPSGPNAAIGYTLSLFALVSRCSGPIPSRLFEIILE